MASEKLASIEPWEFRLPSSSFTDNSWFSSETFSRETETFTKALQQSISPFLHAVTPETAPSTPTISNVSASDHETSKKRHRNVIPVVNPNNTKVSKRKSRVSKRKSQTTFITADPANFRQMVQQVTGARFGSSQVSMEAFLMPEPQRIGNRLTNFGIGVGCLPTLDTSAFLLDNNHQVQQNVIVGPRATSAASSGTQQIGDVGPLGGYQSSAGDELDFDSLESSFPTLESWKFESHVLNI
ncbi:hypothetical protein ACFE04_015287 [Oxalis oulophora]